jgi:lysophospholipase L1-like esterase
LHVGDSFVDAGLSAFLRTKFNAEDTKYLNVGKPKSYLYEWATGADIDRYYYGYRPSLILITLGANETHAPAGSRKTAVRQLVRRLNGTPCIWISTPLWDGAGTAVSEDIRTESAPCRHFDSSTVAPRLTRMRDKIHPDKEGGRIWGEAFWEWLEANRDKSRGYWGLKDAPTGEHE